MRKKLILSLLALSVISTQTIAVSAATLNSDLIQQKNQYIQYSNNEYEFKDVDQETINKMKANLEVSKSRNIPEESSLEKQSKALSSLMAKGMYAVGLDDAAYALDYSMKALRPEPLFYNNVSRAVMKMWANSPDFENVVKAFLWEARNSGKYEYFKSTTMAFNSPGGVPTNTKALDRMDLYLMLNKVNINLGVVKSGMRWHVLVLITDRYDFSRQQYNSVVDIANNIAVHEQELGYIKPYNIEISADRANLQYLPFGVPSW